MGVLAPAAVITVLYGLMFSGVDGMTGQWSVCVGSPPDDVFYDPEYNNVPAWLKGGDPLASVGRGPATRTCTAYFSFWFLPKEHKLGSDKFYFLRKLKGGLKANGQDYQWVSYRDYVYNNKPCTPVRYDDSSPLLVSWLKQARIKTCVDGYKNKNILGACNEQNGQCSATFCNKAFMYDANYATKNVDVLCLSKVNRTEVEITSADPLKVSGYQKPAVVLQDSRENGGSTAVDFKISWTYKQTISSSYSTEHGWRLKVAVAYKSGLLGDAIAKWEASVETEAHGKYITSKKDEETKEINVENTFKVPAGKRYEVKMNIYQYKMDIPFTATEKYFDEKDNLIGEATIKGVWKGVFTLRGSTKIKEGPLKGRSSDAKSNKEKQSEKAGTNSTSGEWKVVKNLYA